MDKAKQDSLDKISEGRWVDKVEITYGDAVKIRKCRVKDLRLVSKFIGTIVQEIGLTNDGKYTANLKDTGVILQLVTNSADDIYHACAVLTDKDVAYLEELDIDDGIKVITRAYEINKSFFWEKVYPLVEPLLGFLGMNILSPESDEKQEMQSSQE